MDDAKDELSERALATRLVAVLGALEEHDTEVEKARDYLKATIEKGSSLREEATAIKRNLGQSAKGKKGSRPTHAADSGLPPGHVKELVMELMVDGEARTSQQVIEAIGAKGKKDKQNTRSLLRSGWQQGKYTRDATDKRTNTGHSIYAYQLADSQT